MLICPRFFCKPWSKVPNTATQTCIQSSHSFISNTLGIYQAVLLRQKSLCCRQVLWAVTLLVGVMQCFMSQEFMAKSECFSTVQNGSLKQYALFSHRNLLCKGYTYPDTCTCLHKHLIIYQTSCTTLCNHTHTD